MTPLEITRDRTTIGDRVLGLGWETLALAHFRHDPPSPLELENAIAAIEDEIARVQPVADGAELQTSDAFIRDIAVTAGISPASEMLMTVDAVEQVFQRLAARRPHLPSGRGFAAALLILREAMHHLEFRSILVIEP